MKDLIRLTDQSPRTIVHKIIRGANEAQIRSLGNFETLYRTLTNVRERASNPKPYLYEQLRLSEVLCKTHINTEFFRYGVQNYGSLTENDSFLLFYSDHGITNLKRNHTWCVDGTFDVVSLPYKQLYTISYLKNHAVYPCVFAICKDKSCETYNNILHILKQREGEFTPGIIKTDFEQAAISALTRHFPNSRVSGCVFHLGQAI